MRHELSDHFCVGPGDHKDENLPWEKIRRDTTETGSSFSNTRYLRYPCLRRWNVYFSMINLTWRKAYGLKQNHLYATHMSSFVAAVGLIFSTFQCSFLSCSHTEWAEVCRWIHGMFSLQTPVGELWLTAQHDRRHLNCLITDPGCDRLSFPERNCRRAVWAEVQLLYLVAVQRMCVCSDRVSYEFARLYWSRPSVKHQLLFDVCCWTNMSMLKVPLWWSFDVV